MSLKNLRSSKQPSLTAVSLSTVIELSSKYVCRTYICIGIQHSDRGTLNMLSLANAI